MRFYLMIKIKFKTTSRKTALYSLKKTTIPHLQETPENKAKENSSEAQRHHSLRELQRPVNIF